MTNATPYAKMDLQGGIEMIDFVKVGGRIASHRKRLGLSQEELASRLYVTRQAVSKWEKGASVPSVELLCELARLYSVSFEELLGLFTDAPSELDPENIFKGHDRGYIISKIVSGEIRIVLADVFYQFSPAERMLVLSKIRDGELGASLDELLPRLTPSEKAYLLREYQ